MLPSIPLARMAGPVWFKWIILAVRLKAIFQYSYPTMPPGSNGRNFIAITEDGVL